MKRFLTVAVAMATLAGCAQSRSGMPKVARNSPPVGLAPVPSIHEIINKIAVAEIRERLEAAVEAELAAVGV